MRDMCRYLASDEGVVVGIEEEQLGRLVAALDPVAGDGPPQDGTVRYEAIRDAAFAARCTVRTAARPADRQLVLKGIRDLTRTPTDQDQR